MWRQPSKTICIRGTSHTGSFIFFADRLDTGTHARAHTHKENTVYSQLQVVPSNTTVLALSDDTTATVDNLTVDRQNPISGQNLTSASRYSIAGISKWMQSVQLDLQLFLARIGQLHASAACRGEELSPAACQCCMHYWYQPGANHLLERIMGKPPVAVCFQKCPYANTPKP